MKYLPRKCNFCKLSDKSTKDFTYVDDVVLLVKKNRFHNTDPMGTALYEIRRKSQVVYLIKTIQDDKHSKNVVIQTQSFLRSIIIKIICKNTLCVFYRSERSFRYRWNRIFYLFCSYQTYSCLQSSCTIESDESTSV